MMKVEIIYQHNRPYGIRNKNGYLLFFPRITKFPDQDERYKRAIKEQMDFAESLCDIINSSVFRNS